MKTEPEIRKRIAHCEDFLRQNEEAERRGIEPEWDERALQDHLEILRWVLNGKR